MIKRVLAILLASLLVYNSAGFILTYSQLKSSFKREAKEKIRNYLPESELTVLKIHTDVLNSPDFERVESHEIRYFGKMYDIFSEYTEGDTAVFLCVCDEKENRLNEVFNVYFDNNVQNDNSKSASANILRTLIKFAIMPEINSDILLSFNTDFDFFRKKPLINAFIDIPTPPPRIIS